MLTKKHFKLLARAAGRISNDAERNIVTQELIQQCNKQNPQFNEGMFMEAVDNEYMEFATAKLR